MRVFERYTDQARRVVYFARFEALHRGSKVITAADLLVGLTWEAGTRADRIAGLRDHLIEIRAMLDIPHRPSTATPYDHKEEIPLDDDSKKILAYATYEADRRAQYWIDSDHLLRAVLRFDNPAKFVLESFGMKLSELRAESRASRRETPAAPVPPLTLAKYWFIHNGLILAVVVAVILGAVHLFMNNWKW